MQAGDHVRVLRGSRWEHAIDCGDRTVIRFAGADGAPAVLHSPWGEFALGADRVEVVTHPVRAYPAKMVVARAFSRFGEAAFAHMFRDSEQFAVWCKTGQLPAAPPPGEPERAPAPGRRPAGRRARPARPARKPKARKRRAAARPPARKARGGKGPRRPARKPARRPRIRSTKGKRGRRR